MNLIIISRKVQMTYKMPLISLSWLKTVETLVAVLFTGILSDAMCVRLSDAFGFLGALRVLPLALGLTTVTRLLYLRREFVLRLE